MEKENCFKIIFVISFIIFLLASIFLTVKYLSYHKNIFYEKDVAINYIKSTSNTLSSVRESNSNLFVLEIPKINLQKSVNENILIDHGIEFHKESILPEFSDNGVVILSSHSGSSMNAYFNKLSKLDIYDEAYIYLNGTKYIYQVSDYFEIDKTGYMNVTDKYPLILVTCSGSDKQLIVVFNLLAREYY